MDRVNQEDGKYRVLLTGIADDSEERRDSFCKDISEKYGVSFSLLRKIITRCPIILKKNLSFKRAEALAKILMFHGALVSVEKKTGSFPILLEFQEVTPPQLALETAHLGRTEGGSWSVVGRLKNISGKSLNDTWVIVQLFDELDDFLAFEEVPIPFSPFLPDASSPFKVIFGEGFSIQKISIAFKNVSGNPLSAVDRRRRQGWVEVGLDEHGWFPSSAFPRVVEPSPDSEVMDRREATLIENGSMAQKGDLPAVEQEVSFPAEEKDLMEEQEDEITEETPLWTTEEAALETGSVNTDKIFQMVEEGGDRGNEDLQETGEGEPIPSSLKRGEAELELNGSVFEEATELLKDIPQKTSEEEKRDSSTFPWFEEFRNSVENYYQDARDIFSVWFETQRREGKIEYPLHSFLTILVHARFDQMNQREKALESTQEVFSLLLQPNLTIDEIPPLERNHLFSEDNWKVLFRKAMPRLRQISGQIIEKSRWDASELERLIQVIPQMSDKSGKMATQWMSQLVPDAIEIDFSDTFVSVKESLYRVASRLGVIDPHFDYCQGRNSMGYVKIQSFAKAAFPQFPRKIEEPMAWVGMRKEEGGHCFPIEPQCEGCLFETFCPRLYVDFNPSEKGMIG